MAYSRFQMSRAFGLLQGFCLVSYLCGAPANIAAQATPSTEPLIAVEVSGAAITTPKSGNIFDASPRIEKQEFPTPGSSERETVVTQSSVSEGRPGPVSKPETEEEAEDIPSVRAITQSEIAERAGQDSALMRAVEQSRKLQRRLGVVSSPNSDPRNTLDNLKKTIDKQEELKEKEQYRF